LLESLITGLLGIHKEPKKKAVASG